jgi:arsenate reductase
MTVTVFHNPACGTSRKTLELLRERGVEPTVVEYLKAGWTKPQLKELISAMGGTARDILRERGTDAEALGLTAPDASEDALLDAMVRDPILVNRPIVVTPKGTALCRPQEKVLDLL